MLELEGVSFREALLLLAEEHGIEGEGEEGWGAVRATARREREG